jgi:hypothetical protein
LVLGFGYLKLSNVYLEERIAELEVQASAGFGNVFSGQRAKPQDIRNAGEQLLADMFRQGESLRAPVMQALTALDPIMTDCDCYLETLTGNAAEVTFGLTNITADDLKTTSVKGFDVDRQDTESLTTLTLRKVALQ